MSTIIIGFSKTESFVSKGFRWWPGNVPASHSYIEFDGETCGQKRRLCLGAESYGVSLQTQETFTQVNNVIAQWRLTGPDLHEHINWALNKYGAAKYDYKAVVVAAIKLRFKYVWRQMGRWFRHYLPSKSQLNCTELLIRTLRRAGYTLTQKLDAEITHTGELMLALQSHKDEATLIKANNDVANYLNKV